MPPSAFRYCPRCRAELVEKLLYGAQRHHCPACGFIHFRDPKVAVVALVSDGTHVLLIRRGVEPQKGQWALPGGFMDAGELPEGALARELAEEVGLAATIGSLLAIYPLTSGGVIAGIVLAYAASVAASGGKEGSPPPAPMAGDDVSEARWFAAHALPAQLAFESTRALLEDWTSRAAAIKE